MMAESSNTIPESREQPDRLPQLNERREEEAHDPTLEFIDRNTNVPVTRNQVEIFDDGPQTFRIIEQEIGTAQRSIHINIFSWASDSTGDRITNLLIERARRGVRVTIQADLLGSLFVGSKDNLRSFAIAPILLTLAQRLQGRFTETELQRISSLIRDPEQIYELPPDRQEMLQKVLLDVVTNDVLFRFNPTLRRLNAATNITLSIMRNPLSHMDHSKVFIFDNTTVFSGGMNVGDDYSGGYDPRHGWNGSIKPNYWRDYIVRMRGPASTIHRNHFFGTREDIPSSNDQPAEAVEMRVLHNSAGYLSMTAPNFAREKQITIAVQALLQNARHEILIEHAYIMDDTIVHLLNAAADRGVQVRILRSRPEAPAIERINERYFKQLRPSPNLRIYPAQQILHTKLLCVDGRYTLIGSANLNRESLSYHRETAILFVRNAAHRSLYQPLSKRFADFDAERTLAEYLRNEAGSDNP